MNSSANIVVRPSTHLAVIPNITKALTTIDVGVFLGNRILEKKEWEEEAEYVVVENTGVIYLGYLPR